MPRTVTVVFWLIASLLLASCAGGTIGGLFPAPKILKGKVESPLYYSPENVFSIRLPQPPTQSKDDNYEWTYTKVNELSDGPVIGVVFGPAAFDQNLYHAVLVRAPMKDDKEAYVKDVFEKKVKSRTGQFTQKAQQTFNLNGRTCYYAVYESDNSFLVLSLTDATNSFYVVEADVSKKSARGRASESELIDRKWGVFNDMLESFKISGK